MKFDAQIENSEFRPELERLIRMTRNLRIYGIMILLMLLFCFLSLSVYAVMHRKVCLMSYPFYSDIQFENLGFAGIFLFGLIGIFILIRFNNIRGKGLIIYEELTDEIDWSRKRRDFTFKPPLETKIVIREFLKSTDLPFTSGANGQAFYLVLYFVFFLAGIMIKILMI